MSAFVVSKKHIDLIVKGILGGIGRYPKQVLTSEATKLGRLLWRENVKSVMHRYGELCGALPDVKGYVWEDPGVKYSAMDAIKAMHCYDYQSCEHDGWKKSKARRLTREAVGDLIYDHPDFAGSTAWGI